VLGGQLETLRAWAYANAPHLETARQAYDQQQPQ
jgi:hypothetical protein